MGLISERIDIVEHRPETPLPFDLVEKDRPIFQAALSCGASHLLTGDLKHFGPIMNQPDKTLGMVVQTVAAFLDCRRVVVGRDVPSCPGTSVSTGRAVPPAATAVHSAE